MTTEAEREHALQQMNQVILTPAQQTYVDQVPFKDAKVDLAKYLAAGAEVVISQQNDVSEAPPFSIAVDGTDFWVGCCESVDEALSLASSLGLRVKNYYR